MEGGRDGEDYGTLRAELGSDFDGALDGTGVAGDYRLFRRIQVGGGANFAVRGAFAGIGYHRGRKAHNGSHGAYACRNGFLHVGAALPDQLHGIGELHRAGGYESGVFAEAVACYKIGSEAAIRKDAIDGYRTGEDGRLRIGGKFQLVFGA